MSNAHNGANGGTVSAFRDAADGTLTSTGSSPFADLQTAPCWVEISHDGRFLFTTNTGSGSVSRYRIAGGGALTLLGTTPVKGGGGVAVTHERLSPDGRYLLTVESNTGAVDKSAPAAAADLREYYSKHTKSDHLDPGCWPGCRSGTPTVSTQPRAWAPPMPCAGRPGCARRWSSAAT